MCEKITSFLSISEASEKGIKESSYNLFFVSTIESVYTPYDGLKDDFNMKIIIYPRPKEVTKEEEFYSLGSSNSGATTMRNVQQRRQRRKMSKAFVPPSSIFVKNKYDSNHLFLLVIVLVLSLIIRHDTTITTTTTLAFQTTTNSFVSGSTKTNKKQQSSSRYDRNKRMVEDDKNQQHDVSDLTTMKEEETSGDEMNSYSRRQFQTSILCTSLTAGGSCLLLKDIVSPPLALAAAGADDETTTSQITTRSDSINQSTPSSTPPNQISWPLGKIAFSLLPLAGTYTTRYTVQECIIPNTMWTHDQIQGVVNVNVPVRQTVIKLSPQAGGGLWIHNPLAPTQQLLKYVYDLEKQHGPVRHIVLSTSALEHKATFGAFCQRFPKATVWIQPGQWSFPIKLPIEVLGVTQRGPKLRELPNPRTGEVSLRRYETYNTSPPEWSCDIEYETLGPLRFKSVGTYSESVFFHKPTRTLLVTDCVVSVPIDPPPILQVDSKGLLFHARDNALDIVEDTIETRRKGWRRMVQFGLVFFPSQIDVSSVGQAVQDVRSMTPSMKQLGDGAVPFGLYPWSWHSNDTDQRNFEQISQNGKIFCPPILTKLILDREPLRVKEFVNRVLDRFDFTRIVPCHLANNIQYSSSKQAKQDFYEAFEPIVTADPITKLSTKPQRPLAEDLALLQKASDLLTKYNVVAESQVCDGEPARQVGRFASTYKASFSRSKFRYFPSTTN